MKISIVTNQQNTKLFDSFIQEFALSFTDISNAFLINDGFNEKKVIKNPDNSKKLTLFPYQSYLNNELKFLKNNFYIFSAGLFKQNNEIINSDIILLFINLEKLNENTFFKLIKKINKYSININKTIFIPWCKSIKNEYKLNLMILEDALKNNLMTDIFELNKYQDKEFINLIVKKIRDF